MTRTKRFSLVSCIITFRPQPFSSSDFLSPGKTKGMSYKTQKVPEKGDQNRDLTIGLNWPKKTLKWPLLNASEARATFTNLNKAKIRF